MTAVTTEEPPKSPFRSLRMLWHRLTGTRIAVLDGVRLHVGPGAVPRSVSTAIFKDMYEAPERMLVAEAVRPGDTVVEIGTGIGFISLLAARLAQPGRVHSYEANPALKPVIEANYALNGLTPDLTMKAVTGDGAPVEFFANDNIVSSSTQDRGLAARKIRVDSEALDAVLARTRPTVIVIDIEGAEIGVLAESPLAGVRELVIELHPHIVGDGPTASLLDSLAARGFRLVRRVHKNVRMTRPAEQA
ncbi:MAG: FkbM family methyltransferase [Paracoccaceae bacterium]